MIFVGRGFNPRPAQGLGDGDWDKGMIGDSILKAGEGGFWCRIPLAMKNAKKAVRKAAVARKKAGAAKKARAKSIAGAGNPQNSGVFVSGSGANAGEWQQADDILKDLGHESSLALRDAVVFEAYVTHAAVLLREADSLRKRKAQMGEAELRAWHERPERRIKLHAAIDLVAKKLGAEISGLRETLKQGEDVRNRIIHGTGQQIAVARFVVLYMLAKFPPPDNAVDAAEAVGRTAALVKKMREEMKAPGGLALRAFRAAFNQYVVCAEKIRP